MTSIEWLFNELWETPKDKFEWYFILNKAKEMHKQEIIDAHISGYDSSGESAKDYYDFYYGSKGSDECPFFISLTKTTSATICSACGKEKYLHKT